MDIKQPKFGHGVRFTDALWSELVDFAREASGRVGQLVTPAHVVRASVVEYLRRRRAITAEEHSDLMTRALNDDAN